MSERDFNLRVGEEALKPRAPGFIMTRRRAAILVILGYAGLALAARLFLYCLQWIQGFDDLRAQQVSWFIAGLMALLCMRALYNIYRRTGLPTDFGNQRSGS